MGRIDPIQSLHLRRGDHGIVSTVLGQVTLDVQVLDVG